MRDSMKTGKKLALAIDSGARCKMETITGNWGKWAIVRDSQGRQIGKHRTAPGAWESAWEMLRKGKK